MISSMNGTHIREIHGKTLISHVLTWWIPWRFFFQHFFLGGLPGPVELEKFGVEDGPKHCYFLALFAWPFDRCFMGYNEWDIETTWYMGVSKNGLYTHTVLAVLLELLCSDIPKWGFVLAKRWFYQEKMPFMRWLKQHYGDMGHNMGYTQPTMREWFKIGNPSEMNDWMLKMTKEPLFNLTCCIYLFLDPQVGSYVNELG